MVKALAIALLSAVVLGVAPAPALAKEGVAATLNTLIPLNASPGEQLRITWTLAYLDEQGKREPFNASGVFVRLFSSSAGTPTTGFASPDAHPTGEYVASVPAPEGGIGAVQIGLRGWSDSGASDVLFPINNNPLPAPRNGVSVPSADSPSSAPAAPEPASESGANRSAATMAFLALISTLILGSLGVLVRRRRHAAS
jgi:hypothetical protein